MKNIFISHSSKNVHIAEFFSNYLENLGIKSKNIFCSSVISSRIKNGEDLNKVIANAIKNSDLLIYLISQDFIESPYCMEELGVGWYLAQEYNKKSYYLLMPDVDKEKLYGFVNSKIHQFSFITNNKYDELIKFTSDIYETLRIKRKSTIEQTKYINIFLQSVNKLLDELIEAKHSKEQQLQANKIQLNLANKTISQYKQEQLKLKDEFQRQILEKEFTTIENLFFILGVPSGIKSYEYKCLNKSFWFNMINRYEELVVKLNIDERDHRMLILIASIYTIENDLDKAYEYYTLYVKFCESNIYYSYFSDFLAKYKKSAQDIIKLLEMKILKEKEGIVKDSYKETLIALQKREERFK